MENASIYNGPIWIFFLFASIIVHLILHVYILTNQIADYICYQYNCPFVFANITIPCTSY